MTRVRLSCLGQGMISILVILLILWTGTLGAFERSGKLEIHYINVGQGGATLLIGPDGTRILYDFGNVGRDQDILHYLQEIIRLSPQEGLHYTIVSHRDKDHYGGFRGVIEAGFEVMIANYGPGSPKPATRFIRKMWLDPAETTLAGAVRVIPVGMRIPLGDGAELIVVAANGAIHGDPESIPVVNENDRSVALFIHYHHFHYLLDGDLGAGPEECTQHETRQKDLQTQVAQALLRENLMPETHGVDVLHIAHHGSESSTSATYYNLMKPEVGLISVGRNQGNFLHPRRDVVARVLLEGVVTEDGTLINRPPCVEAPPLQQLFQTEDGLKGCSTTGCTSTAGLAIGDIKLVTDGRTGYTITGNNRVHGGDAEANQEQWIFTLDENSEE